MVMRWLVNASAAGNDRRRAVVCGHEYCWYVPVLVLTELGAEEPWHRRPRGHPLIECW